MGFIHCDHSHSLPSMALDSRSVFPSSLLHGLVLRLTTFLLSAGVGITLLVMTAKPAASFFGDLIINLQTAFFCISISLNIICTVLIAGMLWYRQWHLRRLGSLHANTPTFNGAIAIIVESAALYSVVGIIVIPTVVRQLPLQSVMVTLIGTVTVSIERSIPS